MRYFSDFTLTSPLSRPQGGAAAEGLDANGHQQCRGEPRIAAAALRSWIDSHPSPCRRLVQHLRKGAERFSPPQLGSVRMSQIGFIVHLPESLPRPWAILHWDPGVGPQIFGLYSSGEEFQESSLRTGAMRDCPWSWQRLGQLDDGTYLTHPNRASLRRAETLRSLSQVLLEAPTRTWMRVDPGS